MSVSCCCAAGTSSFLPPPDENRGPLLGAQHHVEVPADLVVEGVGAGLLLGDAAAVGVEHVQLVELFHGMPADDEIDAGVQPALGHQGDAGGLGRLVQVLDGLAVVRADQRDPGFQSRLEGIGHEGQRQEIDDGVKPLFEQGHQGLFGRAVHLDRLDLGDVGDGRQFVPLFQADIRTDNFAHSAAARQVQKSRLALHAQVRPEPRFSLSLLMVGIKDRLRQLIDIQRVCQPGNRVGRCRFPVAKGPG